MWQVENDTPFMASGIWTRGRDGGEVWMVAVRCSLRINPDGTTAVADEQEHPVVAPKFGSGPGAGSLVYDSDFYLTKPTTDVLLRGHAYAAGAKPATSVDVSLRIGDLQKSLRVTGDRVYQHSVSGVSVGSPQPFMRMPLVYERAYGGREPDPVKDPVRPHFDQYNPVGTGLVPVPGKIAPNIETLGSNGGSKAAGFGPIPAHWRQRVQHAGTYDEAWQKNRLPLYPLDLDDRFFLCSPEDQRPKHFFRGGEPVELLNLTPAGRMAFLLPRLAFRFETDIKGKPRIAHRGTLHTVIIEPDVPRVVLVWRTSLPAHADVQRLDRTRVSLLSVTNAHPRSVPSGIDEGWRDPDEEGG
ncbi:MAG: DUF2169 domain-containing protein [Mesorhizobium sp.]|nr:MAG: DUF2169 domain-containing protein [Mesorhizobium sp.]